MYWIECYWQDLLSLFISATMMVELLCSIRHKNVIIGVCMQLIGMDDVRGLYDTYECYTPFTRALLTGPARAGMGQC